MWDDGVSREVNSGVEVREDIKQQEDNAQTPFRMRWLTSVPDRNVLSVDRLIWMVQVQIGDEIDDSTLCSLQSAGKY